ncbi:MAG: prepilin-type N-terminal cleavage/methylation domain-containing protein, partial [Terriglobales bacterium]
MGRCRHPRALLLSRLRTMALRKPLRCPLMEMSKLRLRAAPSRGFTLIETLVAMFILSVGLVALGSLAAQTLSGTTRTHYS